MAWSDKVMEGPPRTSLWEILVPTEKRVKTKKPAVLPHGEVGAGELYRWGKRNSYSTRFHRVWDTKVREISGGLTILSPAKGQWVSPDAELFTERMIPVRIVCTREQIDKVIEMTLQYYDQLAVLCYKLSDEVILRHRK